MSVVISNPRAEELYKQNERTMHLIEMLSDGVVDFGCGFGIQDDGEGDGLLIFRADYRKGAVQALCEIADSLSRDGAGLKQLANRISAETGCN